MALDREHQKEYQKKWYLLNREQARINNLAWKRDNPEKVRFQARKAQRKRQAKGLLNTEKIRQYYRDKYRNDPAFKLARRIRCRVNRVLRGGSKSETTLRFLGCSFPELIAHLESQFTFGMTWENYGPVWHVDHVRPCASFDLTDPVQQKQCFHFSNLQPLFAFDNLSKGAKYVA